MGSLSQESRPEPGTGTVLGTFRGPLDRGHVDTGAAVARAGSARLHAERRAFLCSLGRTPAAHSSFLCRAGSLELQRGTGHNAGCPKDQLLPCL